MTDIAKLEEALASYDKHGLVGDKGRKLIVDAARQHLQAMQSTGNTGQLNAAQHTPTIEGGHERG